MTYLTCQTLYKIESVIRVEICYHRARAEMCQKLWFKSCKENTSDRIIILSKKKYSFILQVDICYHLVHLLLYEFFVGIKTSRLYSQVLFENFNSRKLKQNKIQEKSKIMWNRDRCSDVDCYNTTISRKIRNLKFFTKCELYSSKGEE